MLRVLMVLPNHELRWFNRFDSGFEPITFTNCIRHIIEATVCHWIVNRLISNFCFYFGSDYYYYYFTLLLSFAVCAFIAIFGAILFAANFHYDSEKANEIYSNKINCAAMIIIFNRCLICRLLFCACYFVSVLFNGKHSIIFLCQ